MLEQELTFEGMDQLATDSPIKHSLAACCGFIQETMSYLRKLRGLLWPGLPPEQHPPATPTADAKILTPLYLQMSRWTPSGGLKHETLCGACGTERVLSVCSFA